MLKRFIRKMHHEESGITGLETAIILIAFVVVAAVFAYTALSSGLFATQKSKEAVYSGLETAQSSIEMKGGVVAKSLVTGASGTVAQITFTLSSVLGGESVDFTEPTAGANTGLAAAASNNKVVISYIDINQRVQDLYWQITPLGNADADDMLEDGEKFLVTVGGVAGAAGSLVQALTPDLSTNDQFTLEVKTPNGAVLTVGRTTPSYLETINNLN